MVEQPDDTIAPQVRRLRRAVIAASAVAGMAVAVAAFALVAAVNHHTTTIRTPSVTPSDASTGPYVPPATQADETVDDREATTVMAELATPLSGRWDQMGGNAAGA